MLGPGWVLAHRRLAVFDVSAQGGQPMRGWDHTIVFNGAVYNYPELRTELEGAGYQFRSKTDTEVLLAAFVEWGTDCFRRFNGMWALAIRRHRDGCITLSRDRFGIKPLYYTLAGGLTFASEPDAIVRTTQTSGFDHTIAQEFVSYGWQDHRTETLWTGINQFPAGHYATVCPDTTHQLSPIAYYDLAAEVRATLVPPSELAALAKLRKLLQSSVTLRTQSDVGRCITLSGGIDSSSITGLMVAGTDIRPQTFSVLFPGTEVDESAYVASINEKYGLESASYTPEYNDFLDAYSAAQRVQGQPLASMAVVIHYNLMRRIQANNQKVLLNGQGADEIGAGYDKFYLPLLREQMRGNPLAALATLVNYARYHSLDTTKMASRLFPLLARKRKAEGGIPPDLLRTNFDRVAAVPFVRSDDQDVYSTSVNLLREVGLPVLLRHEDRNTMAFGLESRAPFLDHRVVEYLLALPKELKIRRGVRKYAIREACRDVLSPQVYNRHDKLGFATPTAYWMGQDAERYLGAIRGGVQQQYFTELTFERCRQALLKRRVGEYGFVFRCWAWMQFVSSRR